MNSQTHILLTGAGFTHNFGAPLAKEMWNLILNNPSMRTCPRLREALLGDLDFESVYHTVILSADYSQLEKRAMNDAVQSAFAFLDEKIRAWQHQDHAVNIHRVRQLLACFAGDRKTPGFIFTLNQDLFVERYYADGPSPILLGFNKTVHLHGGSRQPLEKDHWLTVPASPLDVSSLPGPDSFYYVKLHGSFNWRRTSGASDSSYMIIGRGKSEQIAAEPLLAGYLNLFELVLSSGRKRLLVCGYGFRDEHVNEALASAIRKEGMELFVLSPVSSSSFRDSLNSVPWGSTIWSAVRGHFPYSLQSLFPAASQAGTPEWQNLCESYFAS
jgi:hypothetical protein